jgi:uncharacterized membrane protein
MSEVARLTGPLAVALNGIAAGIMLSTVVGIVPMMLTMPYDRYVRTVQYLWPRYDPLMPLLNGGALVCAALSAAVVGGVSARPPLIAAAVLLAAVMIISITRNVPVNRLVSRLDPARPPADWTSVDPRGRWRAWNLIRTVLALLAFAANVTAAAQLG